MAALVLKAKTTLRAIFQVLTQLIVDLTTGSASIPSKPVSDQSCMMVFVGSVGVIPADLTTVLYILDWQGGSKGCYRSPTAIKATAELIWTASECLWSV